MTRTLAAAIFVFAVLAYGAPPGLRWAFLRGANAWEAAQPISSI
jgi:hypothetical protein